MTSHENLSSASKAFGEIATTQNNAAAAALAIHLAIAASEAYAAELEQRQAIAAAVADSIAKAQTVSVSVSDIDAAVRFIRRSFVDVDFDPFPDRITIFGDDSSVWTDPDGDGDEGRFVLSLMRSVSLTANPFNE
jgi:hypothetical protein